MSQQITQLLNRAIQEVKNGRLDAAQEIVKDVLRMAPENFHALHIDGVIEAGRGRHEAALAAYDRALRIHAADAELWSNRGNALSQLRRYDEALPCYERALTHDPQLAVAWSNMGVCLRWLKRFEPALAAFAQALQIAPHNAETWSNMGNAQRDLKRFDAALAAYARAIELRPEYAEAWCNKGNALHDLGRHAEALAAYAEALRLHPQLAEAWSNKGNALIALKRCEEALAAFSTALRLNPHYAEAWSNMGNALSGLKRHAEALIAYETALSLDATLAVAWSNKGNALAKLRRFEEALSAYDEALRREPGHAMALTNKGNVLNNLSRCAEALGVYDEVIARDPDYADAWVNKGATLHELKRYDEALAVCRALQERLPGCAHASLLEAQIRLGLGEFAAGWRLHELRWQISTQEPYRHGAIPAMAAGEAAHGKRVLVWCEQGFGDTLQFSRYVPLLRARGAQVVFEVQPALRELMQGLDGAEVVAQGEALPAVDRQIPLMSLPFWFATEERSIPAAIPYLHAQAERVRHWRDELGHEPRRLNIGIACSGNPEHRNDSSRSMPLECMSGLAALGRLYLIQRGLAAEERSALEAHPHIAYLGDALTSFAETAAIVENMDIVISVDTSLAHLAGALGKKLYVLLPWAAEWRWLRDRNDTPWYPGARLFRQAAIGDWAGVMREVIASLNDEAARAPT